MKVPKADKNDAEADALDIMEPDEGKDGHIQEKKEEGDMLERDGEDEAEDEQAKEAVLELGT